MSISDDINNIRTAIYGADVREAIADGIEQCYTDTSEGKTLAETAAATATSAAANANAAASTANTAASNANAAAQNVGAIVKASATQPSEEVNQLWIHTGLEDEVLVPTHEEFSDLKSAFDTKAVTKQMFELCEFETVPASKNRWNPNASSVGGYSANGTYQNSSSYVHETISVTPGDVLYFQLTSASSNYRWICALNESGNIVSASGSNTGAATFTVPSGITKLIISVAASVNSTIMILVNDSTRPLVYIPFNDEYQRYTATNEFLKNVDDIAPLFYNAELPIPKTQYLRYSDGAFVNSESAYIYTFKNNGYTKVKVHSLLSSTSVAVIGFYSDAIPSANSYMKSDSVACETANVAKWYFVNVPANAKSFVVCTSTSDDTANPVLFPVNNLIKVVDAEKERQDNLLAYSNPFALDKFYSHMFTNHVTGGFEYTGAIVIPAESVFAVDIEKRLGFKFTEANVHATATAGKYVVTHGKSGKLGDDFETTSGTEAANVVIASTPYDDLRSNYVYRSQYGKYKVPITSLEEFCYACRANDIYPILQYVDQTELNIARSIIGDNMILYQGKREVFDGFIIEYLSLATESAILERCKSIGKPYIYCMANTTNFTDEQLKSIVGTLHKNGYYISMAGNYAGIPETLRCSSLGFDFISSDGWVNDFESGNLIDAHYQTTFDGLTTTGTELNGILTLSTGETVTITSDDTSFLKKYMLNIRFNGEIKMRRPSHYEYLSAIYATISSDGSHNLLIGGIAINNTLSITLEALQNTQIYEIGFKASRC